MQEGLEADALVDAARGQLADDGEVGAVEPPCERPREQADGRGRAGEQVLEHVLGRAGVLGDLFDDPLGDCPADVGLPGGEGVGDH